MPDHPWHSWGIEIGQVLKYEGFIIWGGSESGWQGHNNSTLKESATEDQHDQHLLYGVQTDLESLQYIDFVLQQPVVEFKQETCEKT